MLRKKLAVLLATVMLLGVMSVSPAYAKNCTVFGELVVCNHGNQLNDGADKNKGGADKSRYFTEGGKN